MDASAIAALTCSAAAVSACAAWSGVEGVLRSSDTSSAGALPTMELFPAACVCVCYQLPMS